MIRLARPLLLICFSSLVIVSVYAAVLGLGEPAITGGIAAALLGYAIAVPPERRSARTIRAQWLICAALGVLLGAAMLASGRLESAVFLFAIGAVALIGFLRAKSA